jgi:hypothetical protein
MNTIIRREFWLRTLSGKRQSVWVGFEVEPMQGGVCCCKVEIDAIDDLGPKATFVEGMDAVGALHRAMLLAGRSLLATDAYRSCRLSYQGMAELDLPMLPATRALEHKSTWVKFALGSTRTQPTTYRKLLEVFERHLVALVEEEFTRSLTKDEQHCHFPLPSQKAARAIADDLEGLGFECDLSTSPGDFLHDLPPC